MAAILNKMSSLQMISPDHFKSALKDGSHFGQFSNGQAVQFSNGNKKQTICQPKKMDHSNTGPVRHSDPNCNLLFLFKVY